MYRPMSEKWQQHLDASSLVGLLLFLMLAKDQVHCYSICLKSINSAILLNSSEKFSSPPFVNRADEEAVPWLYTKGPASSSALFTDGGEETFPDKFNGLHMCPPSVAPATHHKYLAAASTVSHACRQKLLQITPLFIDAQRLKLSFCIPGGVLA
jgi:hypothetical protein